MIGKLIIIFLAVLTVGLSYGQNLSISGKVVDPNTNQLFGANIVIQNTLLGTASDAKGEFIFKKLTPGKYRLKVSMIGYDTYITEEIILSEKSVANLLITLQPTSYKSEQVVVTAGKYEQSLSDLPVSASLISAEKFSKNNFRSLDAALRYVPGVTVTLDQVSIRGSSGYSRGAGSRVLVAFDDIPLYTGDSGEIIWELVPTYEIDRVEIIKGAASALYGSTAIGGVINLIPKSITSNPLTFIKSYYGAYDKPSYNNWHWSGEARTYNGLSISHSQKFDNLGVSLSLYRAEDFGYRQNDYDRRLGGYLKLAYDFSNNTKLNIWGTGYTRARETFNFWKDINNILSPPDSDLGDEQPSNRQIFGASFDYAYNDVFSLSIKPSLYRTKWEDQSESQNTSQAYLYRTEVRTIYKTSVSSHLVSGIEGQYGDVTSNIFGNNSLTSFGIFTQYEYKFNFPLITNVGIRYDNSSLSGLEAESSFSPKMGFNYKLSNDIVLRASFGTGFRAPTLAEAFTSTIASGISVKPNPNIKSESNISFETGINYLISKFWNFDAAVFNNEYYDLIEPSIDPIDANVVFENVTRARIQGVEINNLIELWPQHLKFSLGYNYLWARDIKTNKALRYRHRHTINTSLDFNYGIFNIGADFRFASRAQQIDFELVDFGLVPNGDQRVDIKVLDIRAAVNLFEYGLPARMFVNANNILNYTYVEMIGNVGPIRNYSINAEILF